MWRGGTSTTVQSISIKGNHLYSEREIIDMIATKEGESFALRQLRRDIATIADRYKGDGYYFIDIRVGALRYNEDSSTVRIEIAIEEGNRTVTGSLNLEGNTMFTADDIRQRFSTRSGDVFLKQSLEQDIDALISRYEKNGFPFAEVAVDRIVPSVSGSETKLDVFLSINEGPKVKIEAVRVEGNTETSEHVIVREANISPGETYDRDKMDKVRNRLNRMNIFSQVYEPQLLVDSGGTGTVILKVKEGNTNTFDGVVGYVPGNSASTVTSNSLIGVAPSSQGYVTGLVNVSMRNLFGTARKMSVNWQRDDQYSQELGFRYLEPWIFDFPIDLSGSFDQRQQDTTYVRRSVQGQADLHLSDLFTLSGTITQENVIPSSTVAAAVLTNSTTDTYGLQLLFDSRNDILSPLSGEYYSTDYQIGSKKYPAAAPATGELSSVVQRIGLDAEIYVPTFTRQVLAFGMHGRQLTSSSIELGDLYRFGGATTLRGYAENQFLGSKIGWTNTEYRFILERHTYFFGFFDTGYYYLPADYVPDAVSTQSFKYGYGLGLRFDSSLGNIGVSFALGEGDSFTQAVLHVGLINQF
jgi:outer membrane protein insertion porin family